MQAPTLDADSRGVLLYLNGTRVASQRTKIKIRETCQFNDNKRWEDTIRKLLEMRLVNELPDHVYELTATGKAAAEQLKARPQGQKVDINIGRVTGGNVALTPAADIMSTPTKYEALFGTSAPSSNGTKPPEARSAPAIGKHDTMDTKDSPIPHFAVHPLRFTKAIMPGKNTPKPPATPPLSTGVRYLLAFESPRDALPVPVMDQDVLGRDEMTNIWVRHDLWISSHHCKFTIKRTKIGAYELHVEDLASKNGTEVNDKLLEPYKMVKLEHGDRIKIGTNLVLIVVQVPF